MSSTTAQKKSFTFESLEQKEVLAGNVVAALAGNQMTIDGDAYANEIEVVEIAPNQIQVTGLGGTTVNGAASGVFSGGLIEDVTIRLRGGDDVCLIRNVSLTDNAMGELEVRTHRGDDFVEMTGVETSQSIKVDTGQNNDVLQAFHTRTRGQYLTQTGHGNDVTVVEDFFAGFFEAGSWDGNDEIVLRKGETVTDARVRSGTQHDRVELVDMRVGVDLLVDTWDGFDQVNVKNVHVVADSIFDTGSESDRLHIEGLKNGNNLKIDMGNGADYLFSEDVEARNIYVDTGADNDKVTLIDNHATRDLHAYLGQGNDRFWIEGSSASTPLFDGGSGWDEFILRSNAFLNPSHAYSMNFESYIP